MKWMAHVDPDKRDKVDCHVCLVGLKGVGEVA